MRTGGDTPAMTLVAEDAGGLTGREFGLPVAGFDAPPDARAPHELGPMKDMALLGSGDLVAVKAIHPVAPMRRKLFTVQS
jgi:hypothetical protein